MSKKADKESFDPESTVRIESSSLNRVSSKTVKVIIEDLLANGLIKDNQILLSTKKFQKFFHKTYNRYYDSLETYRCLIDQIEHALGNPGNIKSPKKRRIRDLSTEEKENIIKAYCSGLSTNSIALEYGLGRNAVSIILKENNLEIPNLQVNTRINKVEAEKLKLIGDYTKIIGSIDFIGHSIDNSLSGFTLTSISKFLLGAAIDIKYKETIKSIIIDYIACLIVAERNLDSDIRLKYKKLINSNIFSATDELLGIKKQYTDWLSYKKSNVFESVLNEFKYYAQDKVTEDNFDILYEKGCEFSNNLSSNSPEFISRISFFKSLGKNIDVQSTFIDD